ncbi:hypothetical protein BDW74DRAFT_177507 [Aspergillus multicolor]|uniref:uncharacterized protein n=1 Tax=Aspergillus multicolor TaxID=41759 RepID=UPI003CCD140B
MSSPSELEYQQAHRDENQQAAGYGVPSAFFGLAIISLCLRLASRRMQRGGLGLDDYLALLGVLLLIPFMAATLGEVKNGIGRHSITMTEAELIMQGKWEVVNLYSYTAAMTTIKLSILALLSRMFSLTSRRFRIYVWFLSAWVILWAVALWVAYSVQCRPFSRQWSLTNSCRSSLELQYSASILNAVHDVMLFILPQPTIWKLRLPTRKRLQVSVTFFIGFVATLMGILKITYIQGPPGTPHKHDAYFIVPALIFNALEPLLASICSSLPSIPFLFRNVRLDGYLQLTSLLRGTLRSRSSSKSTHSSQSGDQAPPEKGCRSEEECVA